jgi:hypothetical protein
MFALPPLKYSDGPILDAALLGLFVYCETPISLRLLVLLLWNVTPAIDETPLKPLNDAEALLNLMEQYQTSIT